MALVVDILARAARQCSVTPPSSWLTVSDQTGLEMIDFMEETVADVLDRIDVTGPISKVVSIPGTDAEEYALPTDFYRLQRTEMAVYESLRMQRGVIPVSDDGQWQYITDTGWGGAQRFYRIRGYDENYVIGFQREPGADDTILVSYVSKDWMINAAVQKDTFSDAMDECLLPRKLIEKGIVWRFSERKAMEYQSTRLEYEMLMARYANDSKTRRVITFGGSIDRSPWDIPIPAYIPEA